MADQDSDKEAGDPHHVPELREVLARLPAAADLPTIHAAFSDLFRELGIPEHAVELEVMEFRRALSNETDRGAALFAAAHLEDRLGAMLRTFLVADENVAKPLFGGTAALATFSARIDMAYLLGLVPASVRRELHLIRKIRNDFAHSAKMLDFTHAAISARCNELARATYADKPRSKFIQSAMSLGGIIDGTTQLLEEGKSTRCMPASEIPPQNPETVRAGLTLLAESIERVTSPTTEPKDGPTE